ncbi:hypothetical protein CCS79_03115 [Clostridium diolis]|uniref:ATP-binding protein n=1 Tax=Clostridium diolis TaxID=223919 RepID=UPI000B402FBC|nr:ATP-binding protein [Clostridium diolis]OVE70014.1 hypothetical protein CCS79_03115 [Clostridium diolis]
MDKIELIQFIRKILGTYNEEYNESDNFNRIVEMICNDIEEIGDLEGYNAKLNQYLDILVIIINNQETYSELNYESLDRINRIINIPTISKKLLICITKEKLKIFIEKLQAQKIFFENLIKYYTGKIYGYCSFYDYELCISNLCTYYNIFPDLYDKEKEFIELLKYSISYSGDVYDTGYAYKGLKEVRDNINCLGKKNIEKLLDSFETDNGLTSRMTDKQLRSIIDYSDLKQEDINKLHLFYINRYEFEKKMNNIVEDILFNTFEGIYSSEENKIERCDDKVIEKNIFSIIIDNYEYEKVDYFIKIDKFKSIVFKLRIFLKSTIPKIVDLVSINLQGDNRIIISCYKDTIIQEDDFEESYKLILDEDFKKKIKNITSDIISSIGNKDENDFTNIKDTELIYIGVKEYRNIKNQDVNLSNSYSVKIEDEKIYFEDTKFNQSFFSIESKNTKIKAINALVGKNGAGKTTILNIIKKYNHSDDKESKFVIVYKRKGKFYFYDHNMNLETDIDRDLKIEKIDCENDITIYKSKSTNFLNDFSMVLFSNVINFNERTFINLNNQQDNPGRVIDISNQTIISKELGFLNFENNDININYDVIRQLSFIFYNNSRTSNLKKNFRDIKIPKKFIIKCVDYTSILDKLEKNIECLSDNNRYKEFKAYLIKSNLNPMIKTILAYMYCNFQETIEETKIEEILEYIYKSDLNYVKNLIDTLEVITKNMINDDVTYIETDNENIGTIKEFILSYYKCNFKYDIFLFSYEPISAGETARLLLYSRFYWLVEGDKFCEDYCITKIRFDQPIKLQENLIILIDEGDMLYHPEWQRCFVFDLISFLEEIFLEKDYLDNISLILTTNSPFILSDLPTSSLTFLKMDICENNDLNNEEILIRETFAQNIHVLLSDAFFMENGYIGEFAKFKLNNIINDLLGKEKLSKEKMADIKFTIDIIGDNLIKDKLNQMYNLKLSNDEGIQND